MKRASEILSYAKVFNFGNNGVVVVSHPVCLDADQVGRVPTFFQPPPSYCSYGEGFFGIISLETGRSCHLAAQYMNTFGGVC